MSVPPPIAMKRSMFVTVVAWIFIGLSAFATLMLVLYSVMLPLIFLPMLHQQLGNTSFPAGLSPTADWLFNHAVALCYGMLSIALLHLVAAIGLLRRKEWGRRIFLCLLGFDVLHQLAAAAMQWWVIPPMQHAILQMQFGPGARGMFPKNIPPTPMLAEQQAQMLSMMDSMMAVTRVFGVISAVVFICVLGWIIKRLRSKAIRREFTSSSAMI
jgi:hypothetical protein